MPPLAPPPWIMPPTSAPKKSPNPDERWDELEQESEEDEEEEDDEEEEEEEEERCGSSNRRRAPSAEAGTLQARRRPADISADQSRSIGPLGASRAPRRSAEITASRGCP